MEPAEELPVVLKRKDKIQSTIESPLLSPLEENEAPLIRHARCSVSTKKWSLNKSHFDTRELKIFFHESALQKNFVAVNAPATRGQGFFYPTAGT